ncbi:bacillithiol biosynthesis cysteine-adding enzyme BshC [Niabella ginsenosidivorans]|uniref:Putative cysteine ligase BshC n=1 Tax=Niabella ginsenosidivorans TaxID=1176587 RepID=A0A1A9I0Q6_9BACT|nr:bacillithiol biosynthesis cysteine-adding enzyme BshC [Niabella ginsenosidivorans]ANH80659.1 bacillithiol biosynthesis cysteine-adding enzyme BshC [Niabella ginsenosidivorans]
MDCRSTTISYAETGFFSKLVVDYLNENGLLKPFCNEFPSEAALKNAIERRKAVTVNRALLVQALTEQYAATATSEKVQEQIRLLQKETTFTIVTAHQPNIFTGPLYFIYKILHAIKLAAYCKQLFPQYDFVPVYYMGSEDADLAELGEVVVNGEKLIWSTGQTGAVGRMKVDHLLLELLGRIEAQVGVLPYGPDIVAQLKAFYKEGASIQEATLQLVNELFADYGLVVVIPDSPLLKSVAKDLFKDELLNGRSSGLVAETAQQLVDAGYKVQAHSREINLFYLTDEGRYRIEREGDHWKAMDSRYLFTRETLLREVDEHPERFSPNVILRPLFQEMILPNVLFIGGGGELAYWLQLKKIFDHYTVPYPLLVLRNSFLFINKKQKELVEKLGFPVPQLFHTSFDLKKQWIEVHTTNNLDVDKTSDALAKNYDSLKKQAALIDSTLVQHISALETVAQKKITELGKKMLRAEKRNHQDAMNQVEKLKNQLFPGGSLQERVENFIPLYARYGKPLMDALYKHSLGLEQQFVILEEG